MTAEDMLNFFHKEQKDSSITLDDVRNIILSCEQSQNVLFFIDFI